jgi:hypothetical protein
MAYLMNLTKKYPGKFVLRVIGLLCISYMLTTIRVIAQNKDDWKLDKMPVDLETDLALSSLPPHLRAGATVYLLDPDKGYYVGRQGTNGFICYIGRTDWEWAKFRNDLASPIAFDPEGARTIFPVDRDVADMRASGKFTAQAIKDTVISRIRNGVYIAPARAGLSYMLAPIMRVHTGDPGDENVETMEMPHYMFYAPYISNADVGTLATPGSGPFLLNTGSVVLGEGKGPHGFFIMTVKEKERTKILEDQKDLLKRLADYNPMYRVKEDMHMH